MPKKLSPKLIRPLVCLFFACFLLLGLVTAGDYGQPWDEIDEMDILRMNLWEYARAFGLDETTFEEWAEPNGLSLNALMPISQSIERDHGMSAFYPIASVVLDRSMPESARQLYWHMYCWALFTLGAFALYACCRQLGLSRFFSLLAAFMLLLSPRFFAEGHYNNKDIVLMALLLCVLWQSLRLMKRPTYPTALLFALFGALAANTKLIGLALWGLCALFVLIRHIARKTLTPRVIGIGATALVGFAALYALLTPAMWQAPMEFIGYAINSAAYFDRWNSYIRFRGAIFLWSMSPLPWYYLPYVILATTPLWALLLLGVGQINALCCVGRSGRKLLKNDQVLGLLLVTLLWLIPLGFAVLTRTKVYNGWRHFYFLYGLMLILAAWGLRWLWMRLRGMRPRWLRRAFAVMLSLCMLFTGVGIALDHPYQYVYYQPLIHLTTNDMAADYELDYWNVSVESALRELARTATEEPIVIRGSDYFSGIGVQRTLYGMPAELASRFCVLDFSEPGASYILCNSNYAEYNSFVPGDTLQKVVSIDAYGTTICAVYRDTAVEAHDRTSLYERTASR